MDSLEPRRSAEVERVAALTPLEQLLQLVRTDGGEVISATLRNGQHVLGAGARLRLWLPTRPSADRVRSLSLRHGWKPSRVMDSLYMNPQGLRLDGHQVTVQLGDATVRQLTAEQQCRLGAG